MMNTLTYNKQVSLVNHELMLPSSYYKYDLGPAAVDLHIVRQSKSKYVAIESRIVGLKAHTTEGTGETRNPKAEIISDETILELKKYLLKLESTILSSIATLDAFMLLVSTVTKDVSSIPAFGGHEQELQAYLVEQHASIEQAKIAITEGYIKLRNIAFLHMLETHGSKSHVAELIKLQRANNFVHLHEFKRIDSMSYLSALDWAIGMLKTSHGVNYGGSPVDTLAFVTKKSEDGTVLFTVIGLDSAINDMNVTNLLNDTGYRVSGAKRVQPIDVQNAGFKFRGLSKNNGIDLDITTAYRINCGSYIAKLK